MIESNKFRADGSFYVWFLAHIAVFQITSVTKNKCTENRKCMLGVLAFLAFKCKLIATLKIVKGCFRK